MVKIDEKYSFHLASDDSVYSDTGSVTSSHKERIDALFREKRMSNISQKSLVTTVQVHSPASNLLMAQKVQVQSPASNSFVAQKVQVQSPASNSLVAQKVVTTHTPVITSSPPPIVTSIHVPPPQAWKKKAPTPKEELETMFGGPDQRQQAFHDVRTAVQAQIEKLFADASVEPTAGVRSVAPKPTPTRIPPKLPLPPTPSVPSPDIPHRISTRSINETSSESPSDRRSLSSNCSSPAPSLQTEIAIRKVVANMKYGVDYLGAIQLAEKATNLDVLQEPLKELYYKYRFNIYKGRRPIPGGLHITESGLRIIHGMKDIPGYYELLNPYPTIAVWAAVKLVIRKEVGEHGQMFYSYAFLPLICDPEAQDKYNLYHELNVGNPDAMAGDHPPMFACVMRKVGVPKVLECHGFVCRSSEDAIVIAANLYQYLLGSMKGDHSSESSYEKRDDDRYIMSDSEVPLRPPRKKRLRNSELRSSRRLKRCTSEELLRKRDVGNNHRISKRKIKRSVSDRRSITSLEEDTDTYIKVPLPRSKSFINVTNTYDFKDLLDEVKKKTGLNSVDEVLKQIINPKGMSFSEMDPKYRDILLKVALTLSKDEIYQRSKNIMRKHKHRTASKASILDSDSESSTISSVLRATKRSLSRIGSRASSLQSTKNVFSVAGKEVNQPTKEVESRSIEKIESPTEKSKRPLPKTPMPKRAISRGRISDGYGSCSECGYDSECSSKCYCSLSRPPSKAKSFASPANIIERKRNQPNDSYGECEGDSCAESEKCYCSLKSVTENGPPFTEKWHVTKNGTPVYDMNSNWANNTDTDATVRTASSCQSRGYGSQSSSINTCPRFTSPLLTDHINIKNTPRVLSANPSLIRKSLSSSFSSDSEGSNRRFSRSPQQKRPSFYRPRSTSTDCLSELSRYRRHPSGSVESGGSQDSPGSSSSRRSSLVSLNDEGSRKSSSGSHKKILLVSAVDPTGKVVYRGASQKPNHDGTDNTSILSMKKTAEIAALFSELKLNQTTDLIQQLQQSTSESEDDAYSSMQANNSFLFSDKIENSLGYLP